MSVTYSCSKVSLRSLKTLLWSMHALESVTYFSWAVSYSPKMFVKLTPGANGIYILHA
jgi:hypothetical protein